MPWTAVATDVGDVTLATTTEVVATAPTGLPVKNTPGEVLQMGDRGVLLRAGTAAFVDGICVLEVSLGTPPIPYAGYVVSITPPAGTKAACVRITNNIEAGASGYQFEAAFGPTLGENTPSVAFVSAAAVPSARQGVVSTVVYVHCYLSTAATGEGSVDVWGTTANPGVSMRNDGRAYPIGSVPFTEATASASSGTVFAAPTSPLRVLLRSLNAVVRAPTGTLVAITGTVNGASANLGALIAGGTAGSYMAPRDLAAGRLLDEATPIKWSSSAAVSFLYVDGDADLVV